MEAIALNRDKIYYKVQNYILKEELNPKTVKFPIFEEVVFEKKNNFYIIDGYFFSSNWMNTEIKSEYIMKLDENFGLIDIHFI